MFPVELKTTCCCTMCWSPSKRVSSQRSRDIIVIQAIHWQQKKALSQILTTVLIEIITRFPFSSIYCFYCLLRDVWKFQLLGALTHGYCRKTKFVRHHFPSPRYPPLFPSPSFFFYSDQMYSFSQYFCPFHSPFFFSSTSQIFSISIYVPYMSFFILHSFLVHRPNIFLLQILPSFSFCVFFLLY